MHEQDQYILAAKLPAYQRKVEKAISVIREALSVSQTPALSFSGGKDSIVLLDLAVQAGFRGRLVFFKYGIATDVETPKENIELLEYYASRHNLEYSVLTCLGEVDCWERCGRFILAPETAEETRIFRETNYDYAKKSAAFEDEYGIDLNIIGMRKDESNTRRMMLSQKGAVYKTKTRRSVTCCPLLNFSDTDIWAYIYSHHLRYLSIYDYPYIDRRKNRNEITLLYNHFILEQGMLFHYKQMYPEFFSWLKKRWEQNGGNENV